MTFDAREVAAAVDEATYPPFPFIGLDGQTYQLPNAMTMTERQASAVRNGDETAARALLGDEAWEALADLPLHVSQALGEAWFGEMGEAGKSPGPSRATRRAGQRSKAT